jgi:hypothetical protein
MDIPSIASRLSESKDLDHKQKQDLESVLYYIRKDGANKFRNGELFKSSELTHQGNLLTSDAVLTEFKKKLIRSEPESVKNIINHYIGKLKQKSRKSQKSHDERKHNRHSMLFANISRKYEPGSPGFIAAEKRFNQAAKRQLADNDKPPSKKQKTGGKRTKHKKHNTKKTRRRYK